MHYPLRVVSKNSTYGETSLMLRVGIVRRADRFARSRWNFNLEEHSTTEFSVRALRRGPKARSRLFIWLLYTSLRPSDHLYAPFFTSTRTFVLPLRFIPMTVGLNLNLCPRFLFMNISGGKDPARVISGNSEFHRRPFNYRFWRRERLPMSYINWEMKIDFYNLRIQ